MSKGWRSKQKKVLFESPHVCVEEAKWDTPEREGVVWTVVHRKAAVALAPRTPEGEFLLICEERPAVQQTLWTFPAGQVDVAASAITEGDLIEAAQRELAEETGYVAETLQSLGHYHSSPGFTSEVLHLFLADDITPIEGGATHDGAECILDQRLVSSATLREMVLSGELQDGPSLAIYAQLSARDYFSA